MKIAVLGAGYIGKKLINEAINAGHSISVLTRSSSPKEYLDSDVKWVKGDFNNKSDVVSAIKNTDVVYHLISNSVPGDKVSVEDDLFDNVSNTIQLLECCKAEGVNKIVFLSSASVYGEQKITPIKESVVLSPISTHGIQKLTVEYYLQYYKRLYGFDIKIIRLSNPYGPGQDINGRQGFISIVLGNIINGNITTINGSEYVVRDFIYIDDVIKALLKIIEVSSDEVIFNLGAGEGVTLLEVIHIISKVIKKDVRYEVADKFDSGISKSVLDTQKIQNYIGRISNISLYDGVNKYVSYLRTINNDICL